MPDALTSLFYLLRPILSMDIGLRFGGVDLLDIITLFLMVVFTIKWLTMVGTGTARPLSKIDIGILVYCVWVVSISLIYSEKASLDDVAKFILPMFSFILFKSMIRDRKQYIKYLFLMLVGFLVPAVASAVLIVQGQGLDQVSYWTGIARYQGIFKNPHNFGHNMAFMLMLAAIYVWLLYMDKKKGGRWIGRGSTVLLICIVAIGLFDLYESYVRTTWLGLMIFVWVLLYKYSKKMVLIFTIVTVLGSLLALPLLKLVFHDVVEVTEGARSIERIGSGRPFIWSHNLKIFSDLSVDRQLAGVGVGNRGAIFAEEYGSENVWNSHNDFLEVMMQTGMIGLLVFLFIQLQIFMRILRLPPGDKLIFLALFVAVIFMNFASNSYVVRFSIGHMYYMVLAYIESMAVYSNTNIELKKEGNGSLNKNQQLGIIARSRRKIINRTKIT